MAALALTTRAVAAGFAVDLEDLALEAVPLLAANRSFLIKSSFFKLAAPRIPFAAAMRAKFETVADFSFSFVIKISVSQIARRYLPAMTASDTARRSTCRSARRYTPHNAN